jgi:hypothetical protein
MRAIDSYGASMADHFAAIHATPPDDPASLQTTSPQTTTGGARR